MPPAAVPNSRPWNRLSRGDLLFCVAVAAIYIGVVYFSINGQKMPIDRMMTLAQQVLHGHLDSETFRATADSVEIGGRYYIAVGPLQLLPYLPFALVPSLHFLASSIIDLAIGIPAALVALPLARAYGARGAAAYWVACFVAFGTLLFYVTAAGGFYLLAHAESFLALTLFLIEWAGRRRPAVLGVCLGLSFLARPTTVLAAIPFGIALLWSRRRAIGSAAGTAAAFAIPICVAVAAYGWFNWARFGSPLQTGYAISYLPQPGLNARRALGLFSIAQVPENIRLALLAPFQTTSKPPFFTADPYGLSMLLVSPALLTSLRAGFREHGARLLWIAAGLVAIPVFLYYGGGYVQYGFRYSLDFTPFLVALVAMGSIRWRGRLERVLVVASVVSVSYGILWHNVPPGPQ
jgi:hypothetical protein